ncbi:MAG: glycosyltransferase family 4 protein, partial [Caldilineaceae bacterium]|nr:glycosyltransferase family 4 protein [Caldilineaceae bacterium]
SPPIRAAYRELAASVADDVRTTFVESPSNAERRAALSGADLFLSLADSIQETFGLAPVEAMAAGLPVVAVDAVGTDDIVTHGEEGLLTTNDADALAAAIGRVLDDDDLRADLAANGAAHAQRLDMMHQADRMVAVYRQAMVDRRAGRTVRVDAGPISTRLSDYLRILGQRVFDSA